MNTRTTLFLMVLVGGLGAYIYMYEIGRDDTEEKQRKAQLAFNFDPDAVIALGVEYKDFKGRFVDKDGTWYMENPAGALANESAVKRLLNELERMEKRDLITGEEMKARGKSMSDYGQNQPVARFSIRTDRGDTLYEVGKISPIGDQVYVWIANGKDVISIPVEFLDALPKSMDDVRDRRLFLAKPEAVTRIELRRQGGSVQVERGEQGTWWLTQPLQTRANLEALQYLTGRFHTARIEQFITDEQTDLAVYGFGEDSPYVRIWSELEEFPVKLILGGPVADNEKWHYARVEGVDSVFAVSSGMENLLNYELDAIRERRLITVGLDRIRAIRMEKEDDVLEMKRGEEGEWKITQPRAWASMESRIKTLYEQWSNSRVSRFVDLPVDPLSEDEDRGAKLYTITFSESDTIQITPPAEGEDAERTTDFYYEVYEKDFGQNRVLVHSVPDKSWCEVVPGMIKYINVDPLYYRDHSVLQIDSNEVLRVSLTLGSVTSTVSREAVTSDWTVEQEDYTLNDVRLNDIFELCCDLIAESLVELNPIDLTRFDLDEFEYALTFGLTGESGISRTLLLGRSLDDGTIYGMIRGKDLVFTLPDSARTILYNVFCTPKAPLNERAGKKNEDNGIGQERPEN